MNINIREKLENLSEKFSSDVDVVSLKALYNVPEDSGVIAAREEIIRRLLEKYPDDEEILERYIDEKRLYLYDENSAGRLRGGNCDCKMGVSALGQNLYEIYGVEEINKQPLIEKCGFRVVRTAD